ncbi:unnamed protein product [Larinioides sclopetarius]|uniref:Peptidase S1 domain-containing protein n=1 Tax=Larinioides sclopetarius TaxID=280406 RepID=A0AAV1ZRF1_9ARAC
MTFVTSLGYCNGYYETPTVHECPSKDFSCCIISDCQTVWTILRTGKKPKICGWLNKTPLVCCLQHIHQELDQNPHYLDQEHQYILQQPHYILKTTSIEEEIPQIVVGTPSTVKILPAIEDIPSVGYLPFSARLPIVGYLPFSEKTLHFAGNLPSNEKRLLFTGNSLPGGGKLSFTRNLLSNEKRYTGSRLPSNEKRFTYIESRLPSSDRHLSFTWNLPSTKKRFPSSYKRLPFTRDKTTSVEVLPCSDKRLSSMGEETTFNDEETPTRDLASIEMESPSVGEETPFNDEETPSAEYLPSNERQLPPAGEEAPFNYEEAPSAEDLPSNERRLPAVGENKPFNDEESSSTGDLPSSERISLPMEEAVPFIERRPSTLENPAPVHEMRPRPAERRKRLKISPPDRPSPRNCGRRRVDRSSDLPEGAPRTIDTDSTEITTLPPEEEEEEEDDFVEATVVGGARSNDKWTWMAGIFNRNSTTPFCGGAVIDDHHILTAAHCFVRRGNFFSRLEPRQYIIKVGQIDLSEQNPSYEVEEIKIHESYQPDFSYDDIAIIRLNERLPNDAFPVCLPEEDNLNQGDNVTVLGWGRLNFGGRSSRALQQADGIPIVSNEVCNANYSTISTSSFPNGIIDSMICAGIPEGGIDSCEGDSGGPLLREFRRDRWALVGVVSFGFKCGEPGFPGIYTRVANYLPWITEYVDESKRRNESSTDRPMDF